MMVRRHVGTVFPSGSSHPKSSTRASLTMADSCRSTWEPGMKLRPATSSISSVSSKRPSVRVTKNSNGLPSCLLRLKDPQLPLKEASAAAAFRISPCCATAFRYTSSNRLFSSAPTPEPMGITTTCSSSKPRFFVLMNSICSAMSSVITTNPTDSVNCATINPRLNQFPPLSRSLPLSISTDCGRESISAG